MIKSTLYLAKSAVIDGTTQQLSLFNVIDEIMGEKLPSLWRDFCLVVVSDRDIKKDGSVCGLKLEIELNNKKIGEKVFDINFENMPKNRTIINFDELPLSGFGIVKFMIIYKSKIVGEFVLNFRKKSEVDALKKDVKEIK